MVQILTRRIAIHCRGHRNVSARHPTTLEITREEFLTPAGDCIIGICADTAARDIPRDMREILCRDDATVTATFSCGDQSFAVRGRGSARMTLSHPTDMVFRKSTYVCDRTVAICADTAARDVPRGFVERAAGGMDILVVLEVSVP
ncbi:MAG: DUF371 domain-containing protein [Methanolinea sp.]|nr:DUF371 domain-containing protein [Methanolinea sp.]